MYVTIRKYAGLGGLIDRLAPRAREGFVPILRQAPGFKTYCLFASEDGHAVSVSVFDDRATAIRANDSAREWVQANLKDLVANPPEVMAGEVLLHEGRIGQGDGDGFVTVRAYDGVGTKDAVLPQVQQHTLPVITGAPGFRAYYAFFDEQNAGRGVSVSMHDTGEAAKAANERVVAVMRDKRIAPAAPSVMAGPAAIAA